MRDRPSDACIATITDSVETVDWPSKESIDEQ
jgi:hypothetical protein